MAEISDVTDDRQSISEKIIETLRAELARVGANPTEVSVRIGRGRSWFSNMVSNRSVPSSADLVLLAKHYEINLGRILAGSESSELGRGDMLTALNMRTRNAHGFDRPDIVEVIQHCATTGGVMNSLTPFSKYVDVYASPDLVKNMPRPVSVGTESLSYKTIANTTEDLKAIYELATQDVRTEVVKAQSYVMRSRKIDLAIKSLSFSAGPGIDIHMQYQRLLVPYIDHSGASMVANYSRPMKRTEILSDIPDHELVERSEKHAREIFNNPDA